MHAISGRGVSLIEAPYSGFIATCVLQYTAQVLQSFAFFIIWLWINVLVVQAATCKSIKRKVGVLVVRCGNVFLFYCCK